MAQYHISIACLAHPLCLPLQTYLSVRTGHMDVLHDNQLEAAGSKMASQTTSDRLQTSLSSNFHAEDIPTGTMSVDSHQSSNQEEPCKERQQTAWIPRKT
jgi:hypothetical protein